MKRMTNFSSPLLVGFEAIEKSLARVAKSADGYPPYNIERIFNSELDVLRITLAVAGFAIEDLDITTEDNQLVIRGKKTDEVEREFLHHGIASRQFQKAFVLADGMRVLSATLKNGLLMIDLDRPQPQKIVQKIQISQND
ncbi:MAG: Hsp20 family protein [Ahrensia sp.]|nr:Hsp20 family protein [Ahrensia sp.]